jgi:hypothetical protein
MSHVFFRGVHFGLQFLAEMGANIRLTKTIKS